jgi:Mannosylglycerate hydrolase MGH1-like glycoside hydrolase domain
MRSDSYDRVHKHIETIMPKIERPGGGMLPHPYLVVSYGEHYASSVYCWDNQHMNMRFACAGKPDYFRATIDNLLHHQLPDGFTPSVVSAANGPTHTNPRFHSQPFLMQAALMYLAQTGDTAWAEATFPKLQNYLAHTEENWRAPHGLFRWPLAYMSGFDNDAVTTFFQPDTIIPCDVNAWMTLEYRSAASLAARLNRPEEGRSYREKADALAGAINDLLWDEEEGSYAAYNLTTGALQLGLSDKFVSNVGRFAFQSCSNLIPLYARVADDDRARRMIETYLLSPEHFWSPHGIRSLSLSSEFCNNAVWGNPPRYGPHDRMTNSNWQGPVWIPVCYFAFHALRHYGYADEARDLADRTVEVLAISLDKQGSFAENFHAETGAPLYCTNFASWDILADQMHLELDTGEWVMDPVFEGQASPVQE